MYNLCAELIKSTSFSGSTGGTPHPPLIQREGLKRSEAERRG